MRLTNVSMLLAGIRIGALQATGDLISADDFE